MLNTHNQTIVITISCPAPHPANDIHPYPWNLKENSDSDIIISEPDLESDEDITIVSYWPAPGLPGLTMAFPQASNDSNIESDEDITFVGFQLGPGLSCSVMAIPQANDDNVLSKSKPEIDADSEDIVVMVSLFHLSSRCRSSQALIANRQSSRTRTLGRQLPVVSKIVISSRSIKGSA